MGDTLKIVLAVSFYVVVIYLVWLGWSHLRTRNNKQNVLSPGVSEKVRPLLFLQGFLILGGVLVLFGSVAGGSLSLIIAVGIFIISVWLGSHIKKIKSSVDNNNHP